MLPVLPDAGALFTTWCRGHPLLSPLHGGRVGAILGTAFPAVRVQTVADRAPQVWEGAPLLQVEAWAADPAAASLLARTIVAVLPDLRGQYGSALVKGYSVTSGPFWSPDDANSGLFRYQFDTELLTYTVEA
jgi:hypothetical protein